MRSTISGRSVALGRSGVSGFPGPGQHPEGHRTRERSPGRCERAPGQPRDGGPAHPPLAPAHPGPGEQLHGTDVTGAEPVDGLADRSPVTSSQRQTTVSSVTRSTQWAGGAYTVSSAAKNSRSLVRDLAAGAHELGSGSVPLRRAAAERPAMWPSARRGRRRRCRWSRRPPRRRGRRCAARRRRGRRSRRAGSRGSRRGRCAGACRDRRRGCRRRSGVRCRASRARRCRARRRSPPPAVPLRALPRPCAG